MATGTIEFVAPITGLRFTAIELSNPHQAIEKIVLEAQDDEVIKIRFYLTDVFDLKDGLDIANRILPSIVNRLAFSHNVPVGEPHISGATLPKDASGSTHMVVSDRLVMWDQAARVLTLGEDTRQELARLLEQPYMHHDLYSFYRFSLSQSDPVTRFLWLYNILLQLNNDKQSQVDAFICAEMPSVPQSPRPDRPSKKETVYTRLRNEVGHRRAGTYPEQTRTEIEGNVASFQALVKKAITDAT